MSTPFVAGAGALALELAPALDPDGLRVEIEDTSAEFDHAGEPYEGLMGAGRIDLWNLVSPGHPD